MILSITLRDRYCGILSCIEHNLTRAYHRSFPTKVDRIIKGCSFVFALEFNHNRSKSRESCWTFSQLGLLRLCIGVECINAECLRSEDEQEQEDTR